MIKAISKLVTGAALAGALLFAAPHKAEAQRVGFGISIGGPVYAPGYYAPAYPYAYETPYAYATPYPYGPAYYSDYYRRGYYGRPYAYRGGFYGRGGHEYAEHRGYEGRGGYGYGRR